MDVEKPPEVSRLWHSLIRQQAQVQRGLQALPSNVTHVLRLRTDWVIRSKESFKATVNCVMEDSRNRLWVASYSSAKMPLLPIPYFINDNLMGGPLAALTKLWAEYEKNQFPEPKLSKFFSRSFFIFENATTVMPEQYFWGRYFDASWKDLEPGSISPNCIRRAWEASCSLVHVSPASFGLIPPEGIGRPSSIASFFYGEPLKFPVNSRRGRAISTLIHKFQRYFFLFHPHWMATRFQAVLWRFRKNRFGPLFKNQGFDLQ